MPKTKSPSFKYTAKSVTVQKNNKQCIVEVNRDILSWLVNLSGSSELAINYEKTMEDLLPIIIAATEGGRCQAE